MGKNTLTTHVAKALQDRKGYHVLALVGEVTPEKIIKEITDAALAHQLIDSGKRDYILAEDIDQQDKLKWLADIILRHHKMLIILDNFETNQQLESNQVKNDNLRQFLTQSLQLLAAFSPTCLLITTRYQIQNLPLLEINLGEFPFSDS